MNSMSILLQVLKITVRKDYSIHEGLKIIAAHDELPVCTLT